MVIDPSELEPRQSYALMVSTLIPRPIAWITTQSTAGQVNLAPFSFFGGVTSAPPTAMVSISRRRGQPKDTARNLLESGEGVVHIPHLPLAAAMVQTSAEVGPEVDELQLVGLTPTPSDLVAPPRIKEAAVAIESKVVRHLEMGAGPVDVFFLELLRFHLDDAFLTHGVLDASKLAAVGRLGGAQYCDTHSTFEIPRP